MAIDSWFLPPNQSHKTRAGKTNRFLEKVIRFWVFERFLGFKSFFKGFFLDFSV